MRSILVALAMGAILAGAAPFAVAQEPEAGPKDGTWQELPAPVTYSTIATFVDPLDGALTQVQYFQEGGIRKFDLGGDGGWTRQSIEGSVPAISRLAGAVPDLARRRVLLLGYDIDYDSTGVVYGPVELWSLSLDPPRRWVRIGTFGEGGIVGRYDSHLVLDPVSETLFLIGGSSDFIVNDQYRRVILGDVWSLDLAGDRTWRPWTLSGPAVPGMTRGFAWFDPAEQRVVVVAAVDSLNDEWSGRRVWALSTGSTPSWTSLTSAPEEFRSEFSLYDPVDQRLVMVDSESHYVGPDSLHLRRFDPRGTGTWSREEYPVGPTTPALWHPMSLVIDPATHRLVLFGGSGTNLEYETQDLQHSDVWTTDLDDPPSWQRLYASIHGEDVRWFGDAMLDAARNRVVAVSSRNSGLFAFDLQGTPAWTYTPVASTDVPRWRSGAVSVFDADSNRLFLFGGATPVGEAGDLWELSLAFSPPRWRRILSPESVPSPRTEPTAIHDPVRRRMILFGGYAGDARNDTWELDLRLAEPRWRRIETMGALPPGRWGHSATYDSRRDGMIVFGGRTGTPTSYSLLGDTWFLSFLDCDAWVAIASESSTPMARSHHATFYDPVADRVVALWGADRNGTRFDSHALEMSPLPRWADFLPIGTPQPSLRGAVALFDAARDRAILLGSDAPVNGTVRALTFDRAGTGPPSNDLPGAAFRLLGVGPNPTRGDVNIAFELPRATTVETRLYDVRGRMVRDLGRTLYQPGPHILCWDGRAGSGERLRDGVYFARIVVEGKAISGKIVLMD